MDILAIIPARYASSRFPGKPLALINGKMMIERVYRQTEKAYENLCVATDDIRIFNAVKGFGGRVVMTSTLHQSGTDRCLEALDLFSKESGMAFDVVINGQGDEPYIKPEQIKQVGACFNDRSGRLATLVKRVESLSELKNTNTPKVIVDKNMDAIYFSRTVIPFARNKEVNDSFLQDNIYYKHIGLYGYRSDTLREICNLEQSYLEKTEKLEQLRWIENGYKIRVAKTSFVTYAIDTPQDIEACVNL